MYVRAELMDGAARTPCPGGKVGALCARNQQTLLHVHQAQGNAAGAAQAKQQLSGCRVPAPARY